MKRIWEAVEVTLRPGGREPATFGWKGRRYRIGRVEAVWKEMGPWWDGAGERVFFRVQGAATGSGPWSSSAAGPGGVYELCLDVASQRWMLTRVID
jgi:hypothetical protein